MVMGEPSVSRGDEASIGHALFKRLLTAALVIAAAGAGGAALRGSHRQDSRSRPQADLFTLAGDAMRGREGGTLDEMTASVWVAERAREAGLLPAGDNGTYFQFFPLERFRVSASSTVTLGGKSLRMGRDVVPDATVLATSTRRSSSRQRDSVDGLDAQGRVLVVRYAPAQQPVRRCGTAATPRLRTWLRGVQRAVADADAGRDRRHRPRRSNDQWDARRRHVPARHVRAGSRTARPISACRRAACRCFTSGSRRSARRSAPTRGSSRRSSRTFHVSVGQRHREGPGPRPEAASEYVLFSAHQDHDGERYPVERRRHLERRRRQCDDSGGAARDRPRHVGVARPPSALFIWHGSEERGLMGSRWYVKHPTVPLTSIVACSTAT